MIRSRSVWHLAAGTCLGLWLFPSRVSAQRLLAGEWSLDKTKSELSGRMRTNAASIDQTLRIIVDSVNVCVATYTAGGPFGRTETTERFIADSVERAFQPEERVDSRASTGYRSARWQPNERQMLVTELISREIGGQRYAARNTHTWQLSANTDTLVITSLTQGARGTIPTRRVFVRGSGRAQPKCAT
ncbi:MAG TPA: hypothetical protein VIP11_17245 [Gemmatimonadaceae bacterium]